MNHPNALSKVQKEKLDDVAAKLQTMTEALETRLETNRATIETKLNELKADSIITSTQLREELQRTLITLGEALREGAKQSAEAQRIVLETMVVTVEHLSETNAQALEKLRASLQENLTTLRNENTEKLEQMRLTVDEKLQGTLEKRLGESFQIVSDRLDKVHQGLGEMQNLATGVGDLKRVLTNVKSRGGWAEVQLGALLEDMLSRDQYIKNAHVSPNSSEVVEYAVKLPGQTESGNCLLPIDAKFPTEDYDRLSQAHNNGVPDEIEACAMALERSIRNQAERISEKYIHPPETTNFAIMYLPTEGLFAEVIRRPGLVADLQHKYRVTVTGPTTLAACLSSLQMGFTTLAIQKRSSQVWQVLSAAKAEFQKYGQVWEKLGKQLDTAKRTVEEAGTRTRAVERRLHGVEATDEAVSPPTLVVLPGGVIDQDEADEGEAA